MARKVNGYTIKPGADLSHANLYGANLRGADLSGADLRHANLRGANLYNADLYGANLRGANLYNADLRNADLRGADLCNADLCNAEDEGANYEGANIIGAVFSVVVPRETTDNTRITVETPEKKRKIDLTLIPPTFMVEVARAFEDGAGKHGGRCNWREGPPVKVSDILTGMFRHLHQFQSGQDKASDSGVHHLAHLAARCAILLDAIHQGNIEDDRLVGFKEEDYIIP